MPSSSSGTNRPRGEEIQAPGKTTPIAANTAERRPDLDRGQMPTSRPLPSEEFRGGLRSELWLCPHCLVSLATGCSQNAAYARYVEHFQRAHARPALVQCPHCSAKVRADRIHRHEQKAHGRIVPTAAADRAATLKARLCAPEEEKGRASRPLNLPSKTEFTEHQQDAGTVRSLSSTSRTRQSTQAKDERREYPSQSPSGGMEPTQSLLIPERHDLKKTSLLIPWHGGAAPESIEELESRRIYPSNASEDAAPHRAIEERGAGWWHGGE